MSPINPSISPGGPPSPEADKSKLFEVGHANIAKNQPDEDTILIDTQIGLYAVFDGAGGHAGGEVASSTGAAALKDAFIKNPDSNLRDALQQASDQITSKTEGVTTAAVVRIIENDSVTGKAVAELTTVGDARVYVFDRDGRIRLVTIDNLPQSSNQQERHDALEQQKMLAGVSDSADLDSLTDLQRGAFKRRHVISEYLGDNKDQDPIIHRIPLEPGYTIMVASDGVHDNLTDSEIYALINSDDKSQTLAEKITEQAVGRANQGAFRSKRDDTSVIVLKYQEATNTDLKGFLLDPTMENRSVQDDNIDTQTPGSESDSASNFKEGILPKNELTTYTIESMDFPIKLKIGYNELELSLAQTDSGPAKLVIAVPGKSAGQYLSGKHYIELEPKELGQRTMIGRNDSTHAMLGVELGDTVSRKHLEIGYDGTNISLLDISTNGTELYRHQ
jgi:serine/threonine protein phosphatase PrpC